MPTRGSSSDDELQSLTKLLAAKDPTGEAEALTSQLFASREALCDGWEEPEGRGAVCSYNVYHVHCPGFDQPSLGSYDGRSAMWLTVDVRVEIRHRGLLETHCRWVDAVCAKMEGHHEALMAHKKAWACPWLPTASTRQQFPTVWQQLL